MKITPYKKKDGKTYYKVKGHLGLDPRTGKRVQVSRSGFTSRPEARAYFVGLQKDGSQKPDRMKYKDLYQQWLEVYQFDVKESTLNKTMTEFRLHILPALGDLFTDAITIHDAQLLVNDWYENLVHYRRTARYAGKVFQYGMSIGLIQKNPFDLVTIPKKVQKEIVTTEEPLNYYEKEELVEFLKEAENHMPLMWQTFFRLLAFSGLRKSEALALTWDDIDIPKRTVRVNKTLTLGLDNKLITQPPKTSSGIRTFVLDASTINSLKRYRIDQIEAFSAPKTRPNIIFPSAKGTYLALSRPTNELKAFYKRVSLREITPHGFRHTHCSLLFEAGSTPQEVKDRLGHSNIKTTLNIYAHMSQKQKGDTADRFAKFVGF